ncbi:hypothetical protein J5N97_004718 [Dioscorea zingiberensis]|uniref:Uncharacterized protein n=1 Tax=Dioscorea zingiberensis TaxID=325984 RepID=A0A9D5D8F4_9LILI|nr:hypothetical protein J5N97_004718 [Dioscorea zingiberensis]
MGLVGQSSRAINANVTGNTFGDSLSQWAGKGTNAIPQYEVYMGLLYFRCSARWYASRCEATFFKVQVKETAYVLQEQGNLIELVDKRLGPYYSEEEALQMLDLALTCTNPSSCLRPTMSTVVSILDGKNPVPLLSLKSTATNSDASQSPGISMDGPWMDSSVSVQNNQEEDARISLTSKLLSDCA